MATVILFLLSQQSTGQFTNVKEKVKRVSEKKESLVEKTSKNLLKCSLD